MNQDFEKALEQQLLEEAKGCEGDPGWLNGFEDGARWAAEYVAKKMTHQMHLKLYKFFGLEEPTITEDDLWNSVKDGKKIREGRK